MEPEKNKEDSKPRAKVIHKIWLSSSPRKRQSKCKSNRKSTSSDRSIVTAVKKTVDKKAQKELDKLLSNSAEADVQKQKVEEAINSEPKPTKRDIKLQEKVDQEEKDKREALIFKPKVVNKIEKAPPKTTKKKQQEKAETKVKPKKKSKSITKPKAKKNDKLFFQSSEEKGVWKKLNSLQEQWANIPNKRDEETLKEKQRLHSEIAKEYEAMMRKINTIDEKIAEQNLEKSIWLETLRSLTSITRKTRIAEEEEEKKKQKDEDLNKELHNLYVQTAVVPTSLWDYAQNTDILSINAYKDLASHLLFDKKRKLKYDTDILFTKKKCNFEKVVDSETVTFVQKDDKIFETSDWGSTGPWVSAEHISDSSQNKHNLNKHVKVIYT